MPFDRALKSNFTTDFFLMMFGLILGLFVFTFGVVGYNFEYYPGFLGDGRLNLYFLEHAYKFFCGELTSYWNANFMYPEPNVIAYSDNLLGSAPIYSLFRMLGMDMFKSYQMWYLTLTALNYICAFYLLKYLFKNSSAALIGAWVFAFSMALSSQLGHAQTFPRFAIPLAILAAVKFKEDLNPRYFFLTLLAVVYEIYCGIYLGFMLAIPTGIFLTFIIIIGIKAEEKLPFGKDWFFKMTGSLVLNLAIVLPLMLPYMGRKISPSISHFKDKIAHSIPTLRSHFTSRKGSPVWDFLSGNNDGITAYWDQQIFAGGLATLCLIIAVYLLTKTLVINRFKISNLSTPKLLLLTGAITTLLYLRFGDFTAYLSIYFLPGYSSIRSVSRIINIELIFFAIATSTVMMAIFRKYNRIQPILLFLILGLFIGDNYILGNTMDKYRVDEAKQRAAALDSLYACLPTGAVVSYEPTEMNTKSIYYQVDGMLLAQKHNLKSVNGYTATCPGDFAGFWKNPNEDSRFYWLGGKLLDFDTLYVINEFEIAERISRAAILDSTLNAEEKEIDLMRKYIKKDSEWMKLIEQKANERNQSVDTTLVQEIKWLLQHKKQEEE